MIIPDVKFMTAPGGRLWVAVECPTETIYREPAGANATRMTWQLFNPEGRQVRCGYLTTAQAGRGFCAARKAAKRRWAKEPT